MIAYQNNEIVNAFEYFDEKNRDRVDGVKKKIEDQKKHLQDVKEILELVKTKIEKNEEIFSKQ